MAHRARRAVGELDGYYGGAGHCVDNRCGVKFGFAALYRLAIPTFQRSGCIDSGSQRRVQPGRAVQYGLTTGQSSGAVNELCLPVGGNPIGNPQPETLEELLGPRDGVGPRGCNQVRCRQADLSGQNVGERNVGPSISRLQDPDMS